MGRTPKQARLLPFAFLLGSAACGGANSPGDVLPTPPTPPPGGPCAPGRYLGPEFPGVAATRGIVYSQVTDDFGVHVLYMDVYEPVGDASADRPAIVWLFGGNFKTGERSQLDYYATEFALRGYVTATIDYRKLGRYERASEEQAEAAAQSDAQAAIRFLRSQAASLSLDLTRVGIAGWSAGSITAFNVGYRPERIGDNTERRGLPHTVAAVLGLDGFSTAAGIQRRDPPFVLFRAGIPNGDNPDALPVLLAQAEAAGIPYDVRVVSGARHADLIVQPYAQAIVAAAAPLLRARLACP